MRESNTRFSLSHINLSKLVILLTFSLSFHSLLFVVLGLLLLTPFVALLDLTCRLKIAKRSYHSASVLWNNLPSHLRHVAHHVTPSPIHSPVSDFSISLFLKKPSLSLLLSSLVCIHLGRLAECTKLLADFQSLVWVWLDQTHPESVGRVTSRKIVTRVWVASHESTFLCYIQRQEVFIQKSRSIWHDTLPRKIDRNRR